MSATQAGVLTTPNALAALSVADFTVIADLVHARSGIVLGRDKAYLVESRLEPIVRSMRLGGLAELSARLRTRPDGALVNEVVDAMTTNETLFFRDDKPFRHLREQAIPALHASRPPGQPLRIWSAASSSGQEPYSLAMTVLDSLLGARSVQILGTDISAIQVARARAGLYTEFEIRRGLPPDRLARHFVKEQAGWRVVDQVRQMVEFKLWNLLDDLRPLGQFDLVFCRNVLIYFDLPTKRRVLEAIWSRLRPGGLLYLGGAETTFGVSDRFSPVPGSHQVYGAVAA